MVYNGHFFVIEMSFEVKMTLVSWCKGIDLELVGIKRCVLKIKSHAIKWLYV